MEKERKLQILKAAQKRFSKHGLGKTTLDEVARDLRIGKATIYHYFNSKEDLYFSTIEWEFDQYLDEVKSIFSSSEIPDDQRFLKYFELKENLYLKNKLIFELFQYAFKEDPFERENELLKKLIDKETGFIETVIPNRKDKSENAFFLVMKSWEVMLGSKIKNFTFQGRQMNKVLIQKVIDSVLY